MREVRAVILGLLAVVLVALAIAYWRRPARDLKHVKGYRVEIEKSDGGSRKHLSVTVPMSLVAHVASLVPFSDIGADARSGWNDSNVTPREILDAAKESSPGHPGVITRDHAKIEVTADGSVIEIAIHDDWDRNVQIRVPRALVESLSGERRISPHEILRRLDEMGPGDVVSIRDRDDQVTITAEAR